jgi:hypothetical protein
MSSLELYNRFTKKAFIKLFVILLLKMGRHNSDNCSRCETLKEILDKNEITLEYIKRTGANPRELYFGDDKGREIIEDDSGYVLNPLMVCPHYPDSRTIIFEKNSDGTYRRI